MQESNALQTLLIAMHVSNETWSLPEGGAGGAAGGNQTTGTSEESTLQRRQEMGKQGNEQEQDQESQYEGGALPQPPQNKTRPTRPKARKERGRVILTSLLGTSITLSRRGQQVLINDMGAVDFVVKGTNGFVVGIDQVLGSEQEQQQQGAGPSQGEQQQL